MWRPSRFAKPLRPERTAGLGVFADEANGDRDCCHRQGSGHAPCRRSRTQSSTKRKVSSMSKTNLGVALVTGASSGIGHATAKALQNAGFRVFGTSRRPAAERSDGVTMRTCDVTDDASVAKLVDDVL